jgi:ATPase subunit of ABC transporter with duplicated ATPase domains
MLTDLSGGQRTKVLLGKLLLEKPDILLLDEPTNYLDAEHIEWLKRYLNEYENAFILISHDIAFSEQCNQSDLSYGSIRSSTVMLEIMISFRKSMP